MIGSYRLGLVIQHQPDRFGGDQTAFFRFEVLTSDEFVHVVPVQCQRGLVPCPSTIGAGIRHQQSSVAGFKDAEGRMLDAYRRDQPTHQHRVDARHTQNIHQGRIGRAGPTRFGNDDLPTHWFGKVFPREFGGVRVAWDLSQIVFSPDAFELRQPRTVAVPVVRSYPNDFCPSSTTNLDRIAKMFGKVRKVFPYNWTIGPVFGLDVDDQQCGRFGSHGGRTMLQEVVRQVDDIVNCRGRALDVVRKGTIGGDCFCVVQEAVSGRIA